MSKQFNYSVWKWLRHCLFIVAPIAFAIVCFDHYQHLDRKHKKEMYQYQMYKGYEKQYFSQFEGCERIDESKAGWYDAIQLCQSMAKTEFKRNCESVYVYDQARCKFKILKPHEVTMKRFWRTFDWTYLNIVTIILCLGYMILRIGIYNFKWAHDKDR